MADLKFHSSTLSEIKEYLGRCIISTRVMQQLEDLFDATVDWKRRVIDCTHPSEHACGCRLQPARSNLEQ